MFIAGIAEYSKRFPRAYINSFIMLFCISWRHTMVMCQFPYLKRFCPVFAVVTFALFTRTYLQHFVKCMAARFLKFLYSYLILFKFETVWLCSRQPRHLTMSVVKQFKTAFQSRICLKMLYSVLYRKALQFLTYMLFV